MHAAGDEAGEMRHIDHQIGADLIGDLAETAEIDDPRIRRSTGDNDFRPVLLGEPLDLLHVDQVIVAADPVRHDIEPAPRQIHR